MPDFVTLVRYGKACGTAVGLLFARQRECDLSIVTAVTVQTAEESVRFEFLEGYAISGQRSVRQETADVSTRLDDDHRNLQPTS